MTSSFLLAYPTVLRHCATHPPLPHKLIHRSLLSYASIPHRNPSFPPSASTSLFRRRYFGSVVTNTGSVYCRISRLTMLVDQNTTPGIEFYTEAIKLRNDLSNSTNNRNIILSDGSMSNEASSCSVVLVPKYTNNSSMDKSDKSTNSLPTLRYPYLTFGVSNLKTSSRHAKRKGGIVIETPLPPPLDASTPTPATTTGTKSGTVSPVSSAIFIDPYGQGMRALHIFRRNPAITVTLGSKSIDKLSKFYIEALGMRLLDPSEIAQEIKLLPNQTQQCIVLGYGAAHNTTSLILEPIGLSGAIKISEETNHTNEEIDNVPVIGIRIHDSTTKSSPGPDHNRTGEQLDKLYDIYRTITNTFDCAASPFDRTKDSSFTFIDPEGYVVYVYT